MSHLGENHDRVVKEWRNSFLLDLETQSESSLPSNFENAASDFDEMTSDTSSSEEGSTDENESVNTSDDYTYSSDDDDTDVSDVNSNLNHLSCIPLIAHPPQVMEPSNSIATLPGIPLQKRHIGFRIVGDNIDKTIRRRYLRLDRKNQSLHFFHAFTVANRVDVSQLADTYPDIQAMMDIDSAALFVLPKFRDDLILKDNISILVSRVLYKHLDFF